MLDNTQKLDTIRTALIALKKKVGPRRTEAELATVEEALGFRLPESYRSYLLAIGDGGMGLADEVKIPPISKLSAKTIANAQKAFPLTGPWYSPASEDIALAKKFGLYEGRKESYYALPEGAEPTDGTLPLGVPIGTHEYYILVLRGQFAGQVWVDASGEDTGGVEPLAAPDFLDASLAYFEAKVAEKNLSMSAHTLVQEGRAAELLEKTSPKSLPSVLAKVEEAIYTILRAPDPPIEACRGVAMSALAVANAIDAAKNNPFAVATHLQIATLASLMAGDFDQAFTLAERCLNPNGIAPAVHERVFLSSTNMHILFAKAGLGHEIGKIRPPKRVSDYRSGHFAHDQLCTAFRRMTQEGRSAILRALPAAWGNALEGL